MNCIKCGKELVDGSLFCSFCGKKQIAEKKKARRGNGEGCVCKRGEKWMAIVVVGWREGENGSVYPVKRTKGGFLTKKEALAALDELKKAPATKNPDEDSTFQQIYDRWLPTHESKVGKSTMDCYKAAFKHYEAIWHIRFKDVGVDDMQDCLDNANAGKRTLENMKALGTLLYKYAISRRICNVNYASYLYTGNGEKTTRPAFSKQQIEIIRKAAETDLRAEMVLCMIYTGFRPNEMLSLSKSAYHNENGVEWLVGGFKTDAGKNRTITISPKIAPAIRRRMNSQSLFLFPKEDGSLMRDDYFRENIFYPVLADLNIQPLPDEEHPARLVPYSCRHTFANLMKVVAGSEVDKAALMGHTDYSMTQHYMGAEIEKILAITNAI